MAVFDLKLRNDLREAYGRKALERESYPGADWKIKVRQDFLALLQAEQKHTLPELGAGLGHDASFFQDNGVQVTCTDLSPEMVALCRQKELTAEVMDIADLHFAAGSFEAVYALNCLLHLPKHELPPALQSINTILKPGGFFSFFTDEHLQQVVAEVFEILSFHRILLSAENSNLHFQALMLRKRSIRRA